ncbi:MAG: hypothetical protein V2I27_11445 [Erythrobacter sp.]|jgi:hypothetical protein|nr:hypothetical protein [Erythrobacter sp.]
MKSPVEVQPTDKPGKMELPPFAITGTKSGTAFDIRVATREEAETIAEDFRKQGAEGVTITEIG